MLPLIPDHYDIYLFSESKISPHAIFSSVAVLVSSANSISVNRTVLPAPSPGCCSQRPLLLLNARLSPASSVGMTFVRERTGL